jgi:hypothetical protein
MLCLIPIVGGLLIMMGQHDRSEALFYYFRLEDQVPDEVHHAWSVNLLNSASSRLGIIIASSLRAIRICFGP